MTPRTETPEQVIERLHAVLAETERQLEQALQERDDAVAQTTRARHAAPAPDSWRKYGPYRRHWTALGLLLKDIWAPHRRPSSHS